MAAVSHAKVAPAADWTGTITEFNSAGATATGNATDNVRATDWNSAHNFYQTISGNTLGSSTASGSNLVFGGTNAMQLSLSTAAGAATLWFDATPPNRHYIEIMNGERMTSCGNFSETALSNRVQVLPFWMDGTGIVANTVRFLVSGVGSSNRGLSVTCKAGIYSATNSTQLTLLASDSVGFNINATSQSTVWNGFRALDFTRMSSVTLTAEGRYAIGFLVTAATFNTSVANMNFFGGDNIPVYSGQLIDGTSQATNARSQILPFWGCYSATSGGLPNAIGQSEVNGNLSASVRDVYVIIKEL